MRMTAALSASLLLCCTQALWQLLPKDGTATLTEGAGALTGKRFRDGEAFVRALHTEESVASSMVQAACGRLYKALGLAVGCLKGQPAKGSELLVVRLPSASTSSGAESAEEERSCYFVAEESVLQATPALLSVMREQGRYELKVEAKVEVRHTDASPLVHAARFVCVHSV